MKEIIGVRVNVYTSKKTGELVKGYNLYLSWIDSNVEGMACEAIFIREERLDGYVPTLGDKVKVGYDRWQNADFLVKL